MYDASVVVATWNRARLVRWCIDCLARQDYPRARYEVIVVDDGSTDETEEQLRERAARNEIVYLRQPLRSGLAAARNAGIAAARGSIVIFVDSDAFAPPSFVGAHLAAHAGRGPVVVDGPAISIGDPGLNGRLPFEDLTVRAKAALGFFGQPFVGANASCGRAALGRVKGFDETFGARYGWEDTELFLRLRADGVRRVRARGAWLLHLDDATRDLGHRGQRQFECGVNATLLYAKHRSPDTLDLIGIRALRWDAWLRRAGLTAERVERLCASDRVQGWRRRLLTPAYLTQRYAGGLRAGKLS